MREAILDQICILRGSPHRRGSTNSLLAPVQETFQAAGRRSVSYDLYHMQLQPCLGCRRCQEDWTRPYCMQRDEMPILFEAVLNSRLLLLATPIYSWYCTPPLKTALDRLDYAMNKVFGPDRGPSLWRGRSLATVTVSGPPEDDGADLWDQGLARYCAHSGLEPVAVHFLGYPPSYLLVEESCADFVNLHCKGTERIDGVAVLVHKFYALGLKLVRHGLAVDFRFHKVRCRAEQHLGQHFIRRTRHSNRHPAHSAPP